MWNFVKIGKSMPSSYCPNTSHQMIIMWFGDKNDKEVEKIRKKYDK